MRIQGSLTSMTHKKRASSSCVRSDWADMLWTPWIPLSAPLVVYRSEVPKTAGFYRVKAKGSSSLVYIGQSGRDLRARVRSLARHAFRPYDDPPWNDPHTAAPLLWAFYHENRLDYDVSVSSSSGSTQERQCQEDMLLYLHRLEHDKSTLCNHGRLHPNWSRPSNRKDRVPALRTNNPKEYPSSKPAFGNADPIAEDWLGLNWSEPKSLDVDCPGGSGVYRILSSKEVVYIGESVNLRQRLRAHARSARFSGCKYSVLFIPAAPPHQLRERETDLIGSIA